MEDEINIQIEGIYLGPGRETQLPPTLGDLENKTRGCLIKGIKDPGETLKRKDNN